MKTKKIILRDSGSILFDDLITFEEDVLIDDICSQISYVQQNVEDYSNEDIYIALKQLGNFTIEYIGSYPIVEY